MKNLIYIFIILTFTSCGLFKGNGDGYDQTPTDNSNYSPSRSLYYDQYFLKEAGYQCLDPDTSEMIDSYKEKLIISESGSITIFNDLCNNQIIQENIFLKDLLGLNKNSENKFEDVDLDQVIYNFEWP